MSKRTTRDRSTAQALRTLTFFAAFLEQSHDDESVTLAADIRALLKAWRVNPKVQKQLDEECRRLGMILPDDKPSNVIQFPIESETGLS